MSLQTVRGFLSLRHSHRRERLTVIHDMGTRSRSLESGDAGGERLFSRRRSSGGLSLVELLVVIAIIGLIAVISIRKFGQFANEAEMVKNKRNAQTIAWTASAAQSAGDVAIEKSANLDAAIVLLFRSVDGSGFLSDVDFSITEITPEDLAGAKPYLRFLDGKILFDPGKQPP